MKREDRWWAFWEIRGGWIGWKERLWDRWRRRWRLRLVDIGKSGEGVEERSRLLG